MQNFFDGVQKWTENKLTQNKAKKLYKKQNKTFKSEVLDWLDAILFAVVLVFLINQFIFQLFVIPSPSMLETLQLQDRVIVSKLSYGIEVYPEGPKIFDGRTPDRDEIITFYNPEYESRGTMFNILNQLIFRATLSIVNIDKDENGNVREQLLVKRTAGVPGDFLKFVNGDAWIKASGTGEFVPESEFRLNNGLSVAPHRSIEKETYTAYNAQGRMVGLTEKGISQKNVPSHLVETMNNGDSQAFFSDYYGYNQAVYEGMRCADPADLEARSNWTLYASGIYVPEGYVLPLGDNRDNSGDGRYFGPVKVESVNGLVMSIFWPVSHIKSLLTY